MTEILDHGPAGLARAASLLRSGRLVAFGTETVYGLGADATNGLGVAAIFAAKDRPRFNPLICHYPDPAAAFAHVAATPTARRLAEALWPGPLTMVLRRSPDCQVARLAGAGLDTLAVRVPSHPAAQKLLRLTALPIAAPSANRSGRVSPTTTQHVLDELEGRIDAIVDCGSCPVGVESTVLDLTGEVPVLLRPGGVTAEAIEAIAGPIEHARAGGTTPRSPGLLASHYAPQLPLRMSAERVAQDEALLAFGPPLSGAGLVYQLSRNSDLSEAAANLFAGLRWLDSEASVRNFRGIAAMPIPPSGLGVAINDRLRRAATPQ